MRERQSFPGKLNLFQRMMLRWRGLHPYNAIHVAHVAGACDVDSLRRCIADIMAARGLGGFALDATQRRFVYRGGDVAPEVRELAAVSEADADAALAFEVERQLNQPFAIDAPIRYFALPVGGGYLLGIAYDHFIAGGDAVATLLGEIVARVGGGAVLPPAHAPSLYPPTYVSLLRRHLGWFVTALQAMPALVRESKRAFRPRDIDPDDPRNAYALIRVTPTETAALRGHARTFGVTLHDLVVALLLRSLSPLAAARHDERQRREIGVASIVNIRRDFDGDAARAFGQLLASMRVTHAVPDGVSVGALARDVREATTPIKRRHLYLRTLFGLGAASMTWRFLSTSRRNRFFAKHYPACAGISMLDVDPCWPAAIAPATLYTRGVSTGPLTPAVLAISTTAREMSIGVSWRLTVLPRDFPARLEAEIRLCARQPG